LDNNRKKSVQKRRKRKKKKRRLMMVPVWSKGRSKLELCVEGRSWQSCDFASQVFDQLPQPNVKKIKLFENKENEPKKRILTSAISMDKSTSSSHIVDQNSTA
jgi:hypothetical protein